MRRISKDIFMDATVCPNLAWIERSGRYPRPRSRGEGFEIEESIGVHERSHDLFPEGEEVIELDMDMAVEATHALLETTDVIFEPAFIEEPFAVRADILERIGGPDRGKMSDTGPDTTAPVFHLIEIKNSIRMRPEHIDDLGFTAMVLMNNGINIGKVSLWTLNRAYRSGMPKRSLFTRHHLTDDVLWRAKLFETLRDDIIEVTSEPELPLPIFKWECKRCRYFHECFPFRLRNHIFDLPGLKRKKFEELITSEVVRIEDIPPNVPLNHQQTMAKRSVDRKVAYQARSLGSDLEKMVWPVFYLALGTVRTSIPLYPDTAPFEVVPTQYSIYKCPSPGKVKLHHEFLAHPKRDRRRELALRLIRDVEQIGSIAVYSGVEVRIIRDLIGRFPDLSVHLGAILERIVDLRGLLKKNFYHPLFRGSTDLVSVLPVLVPEMTREALVSDADVAAFADMATGRYDQREWGDIRKVLMDHLGQETLAMLRIHSSLVKLL